MNFLAEFKELIKAGTGSIVQVKSINENQKIDLLPYFINYVVAEDTISKKDNK